MPKPQHTYVRVNRLTQIRHQARFTRERSVPANMSAEALEFHRLLERNGVDFLEIRRVVNQIQHDNAKPSPDQESTIGRLVEIMEKLDDLADEIANHNVGLHSELAGPAKLFMLRINGVDLDGVGLAQALLAVAMFLALLERLYQRYRGGR